MRPSHNSSKLRIVSAIGVTLPCLPVKTSATMNGCDRNFSMRRGSDDFLVFFAQFLDAEDGDDVLQFAIR